MQNMTKPVDCWSLATAGLVEMHNAALSGRETSLKTSLKKKKSMIFPQKVLQKVEK